MIHLVLVAIALVAGSGVPGLFFGRKSAVGERLAAALMVAGGALGVAGAFGGESRAVIPWPALDLKFEALVDGIAAMFLVQIFVIAAVGSVYALRYWKQSEHPENGRKLRLWFGVMTAGMAIQVVATNGMAFLLGFEVMATAAFLAITTEDHDPAVRKTGLLYIVVTHTGALALFAMFSLMRMKTGSWDFAALLQTSLSPGTKTAIFVLALAAFGLKAGLMPLHIWLPSAHANAPSHVSALMSGVVIKTGIYGLVRLTSFFAEAPLWWGEVVLALGVASAVLGVAFAIGQHDLKRLLAYHSVENIGIIAMGLGLAMMGRSAGRPALVALGLAGSLLHVWNHGLFKSLLFLSAGSVIHAVHTREIDHLGGLLKRMPWTGAAFLCGAVAICGLPPLNGFVSEFLVYVGLFRSVAGGGDRLWLLAACAAPALALVGGLAVACFVKVFGAVFLGTERSDHPKHAHEAPLLMLAPMGLLAACCVFIGVAPAAVAPVLDRAVAAWAPEVVAPPVASAAPLAAVGGLAVALLLALAAAAFFLRGRLAAAPSAAGPTWGCGYLAPNPRMQYTSSSFAETLVKLFRWALWPSVKLLRSKALFPSGESFHSNVPDTVLDRAVLPVAGVTANVLGWFRWIQSGNLAVYLLYILSILLFLFLWR